MSREIQSKALPTTPARIWREAGDPGMTNPGKADLGAFQKRNREGVISREAQGLNVSEFSTFKLSGPNRQIPHLAGERFSNMKLSSYSL